MAAHEYNHIPAVLQALHEGTKVAVRQAAKKVRDDYAGYVAVRTGFTKAAAYYVASDVSTYGQAVGKAQGIDEFRAVLPEVDHPQSETEAVVADAAASAIFLEYGTSRMAAQPAMTPAVEAMRGKLPDLVAAALNKAIAAAAKE